MQVGLGPFARQGLEDHLGPDLSAGVELALLYFLGKRHLSTAAARPPKFLQNEPSEPPVAEVELHLGQEVEDFLSDEAKQQKITVERLVAHCVFVYLAELDRIEAGVDTQGHASTN